jgi:hypothetical protein
MKGLYGKVYGGELEGQSLAERMIADIGAQMNAGAIDPWKGAAAQNAINAQFGLHGYGSDGKPVNLEVDPAHQAAFDAYQKKQEEIKAAG